MTTTLVHLIYIHGFQGDDTTFQAFPKDLQEHLSTQIPPHPDITFQSSIYPTYKCVKPLSYATKNFLEWLTTQPPGPVILLGHSMGGLLAAEAATDLSNNPDQYPGAKPKRIVGLIAFDTPYLGLHPHVVISGLASLLPKGAVEGNSKDTKQMTTKAMNDHPEVKIVDDRVTDDWEEFKKQSHIHIRSPVALSPPQSPRSSVLALPHSSSPVIQGALNLLSGYSDKPLVRWLNKHSNDPLSASKRWISERYQFGIAMFDPSSLKVRYKVLKEWQGKWVNYWTQTVPRATEDTAGQPEDKLSSDSSDSGSLSSEWIDNDSALVVNGMVNPPGGKASDLLSDEQPKQVKKEDKRCSLTKPKKGHHFTLLPSGLGERFGAMERWERVDMEGVEDEVGAHLGLFIPAHNLYYEGLVERVGGKIFEWCKELSTVKTD